LRVSTSKTHFWDTCVLARHLTQKPPELCGDIARFLDEARAGKRKIWYSTILYAEFNPAFLTGTPFKTLNELIASIEGVMLPIGPTAPIMMRAGRLRGRIFKHHAPQETEKNRVLSVADAIQFATCLYVKETLGISDIEFHTFDDGKGRNYDVTLEEKVVSLLRFEDYAHEHFDDPDIKAVCDLARLKPAMAQGSLA
jgi:hypothetical protein